MRHLSLCLAFILMSGQGVFAAATNDWPCVQRKVPQISLSAVWTAEVPGPEATALKTDKEISDLVSLLAARRFPLEEASKQVREFAGKAGDQKKLKLEAAFAALFDTLNGERSDVISGIERYGKKQLQFAEKLRIAQEALAAKRADANADPTEVQDMTDQINWDTRIFEERRKSLTYVCEVPVIIEQRLYGLAKTIQSLLN